MKLKWKILIIILIIILAIIGGYNYMPNTQQSIDNQEIKNEIEIVQQENIDTTIPIEEEIEQIAINIPEPVIRYTTTGVNLKTSPNLDSDIIRVLPINAEIQVIPTESEWTEVKEDENTYYIATRYISEQKTKIEQPKVTSRSGDTIHRTKTTQKKSNQGVLTKSKGVNYFNGHKETWYSQKVLPGGGLKIPGRHVAADGTIRDKDNYICVASSDYKKGTIVETSLGIGKVYDCGCASGTIDIYTNW